MADLGTADAAAPFDALGLDYEKAYGHLPEQLTALEWLAGRLPVGARVLDIGSGTGRPVAQRLVDAGFEVTGIDVSATMVDLARQQVPGARFELQDVRSFDAPQGALDAVCAFFPLLQMPRADLDATLERIFGWLAPGGYFVMCTVPGDLVDLEMVWLGQPIRVTSYTAEQYRRRLDTYGFEVLHHATTVFVPNSELGEDEEHLFCYARRPGDLSGRSWSTAIGGTASSPR